MYSLTARILVLYIHMVVLLVLPFVKTWCTFPGLYYACFIKSNKTHFVFTLITADYVIKYRVLSFLFIYIKPHRYVDIYPVWSFDIGISPFQKKHMTFARMLFWDGVVAVNPYYTGKVPLYFGAYLPDVVVIYRRVQ